MFKSYHSSFLHLEVGDVDNILHTKPFHVEIHAHSEASMLVLLA
jgi:hypothetical protein